MKAAAVRILLRKVIVQENLYKRVQSEPASGSIKKKDGTHMRMSEWNFFDKALLGGIFFSTLTIIVLAVALMFRAVWSK
ncbi:hypothetical protein L6164_023732 [Bauhinia variegata]|uniref:Uncharacterized protein n=1 Tax=Bauhinia variegata TaxID=167791 RepID=A0ACB9MJ92_BAUVA|nr:hypothetical protein L6164_023732 [Bauhinia variegata]